MGKYGKVDRARRNALKATGLIVGTIVVTGIPRKRASAQSLRGFAPVSAPRPRPGNEGNCFVLGTQIRTRDGYRPIEDLAVGDEVAVRFGGFAPIKATVRHTSNSVAGKWDGDPNNRPVVIRRGALGDNVPTVDLCLTALHAVYVDGFLMKAGDLVNGTSILFKAADSQDSLSFINIELEHHDILDVQGASCESLYRAGMKRCAPDLGFDGGRGKLRSHMRSVASVVVDRRQTIDIIRDNLEERALELARAA